MDRLTTSRENVGGIFLPVVDEIERLVQEQILQVSMAGMRTKVSGPRTGSFGLQRDVRLIINRLSFWLEVSVLPSISSAVCNPPW